MNRVLAMGALIAVIVLTFTLGSLAASPDRTKAALQHALAHKPNDVQQEAFGKVTVRCSMWTNELDVMLGATAPTAKFRMVQVCVALKPAKKLPTS